MKNSFYSLAVLIVLCLFGCEVLAQHYVEIGSHTSSSSNESNQVLPTTFSNAKTQLLVRNSEMQGVHAGVEITGIQWFIVEDNTPGTTTYDLSYTDDYTSPYLPTGGVFADNAMTQIGSGLTDEGSYTGWHTAAFTDPIIWDGTDNMIFQFCRAVSSSGAGDKIARYDYDMVNPFDSNTPIFITGYYQSCNSTAGVYSMGSRPYIRLIASCEPSSSTINPVFCGNPYISPSGKTFDTPGVYLDTIANHQFCDSLITINLTSCFSAAVTNTTAVSCPDNSDGTATIIVTGGTFPYSVNGVQYYTNPFTISGLGAGHFSRVVMDNVGNTIGISATIASASEDTTPPIINCAGLNLTVPNDPGQCTANVQLPVPGASDNCGVSVVEFRYRKVDEANNPLGPWSSWADASQAQGTFAVGRYRIRWRIKDAAGNQAACTRFLTVEEEEIPAIECFNHTVVFNGEASIALLVDELAEASDNCGLASLTLDINEVYCQELGEEISVTATAVDVNGLVNSCMAKVYVEGLPCGWSQNPNGVGCANGSEVSYAVTDPEFTINSTDCHNAPAANTDEYAFAQYNLCGNGTITAEVTSINGTSLGWAGVSMRDGNDPGAKSVTLSTNLGTNHRTELRTSPGSNATSSLSPSFNRHWLRLERSGGNIRGFVSFNGIQWYNKFNLYVPMSHCIEVGLVLNGYNTDSDLTATFEHVSVEGETIYGGVGTNANGDATGVIPGTFGLFPNPSAGELSVSLGNFIGTEGTLDVVDALGTQIQRVHDGLIEDGIMQLNLDFLPAGLYFIRLRLADGTEEVQRVILQPRP